MTVPGGPPFATPDDEARDPWAVQLPEPRDPAEARRIRPARLPRARPEAAPRTGDHGRRRRRRRGRRRGGLAWAAFNGDTGNQPERHLPRTTAAVIKVDLDPSGPQKIEAARFLAKFPDSGVSRDSDLRKLVYDRLSGSGAAVPSWEDVRDWIGDRAAVAVRGRVRRTGRRARRSRTRRRPARAWVLGRRAPGRELHGG